MNPTEPIAVHHLESRGRRVPVLLFRNAGGSVSGRFLIADDDTPIVDAPTADAVLSLVAELLDTVLLVRGLLPRLGITASRRAAAWRPQPR